MKINVAHFFWTKIFEKTFVSDAGETLSLVKNRLAKIVGSDPHNMKLLGKDQMPLDETQTLAQQRVENESIVYWVEKKGSDQWEEVQIQKPEATSEENK